MAKALTGIDIIEVSRVEDAINNLGDNFLNKIFTENEIDYCNKSKKMKYTDLKDMLKQSGLNLETT